VFARSTHPPSLLAPPPQVGRREGGQKMDRNFIEEMEGGWGVGASGGGLGVWEGLDRVKLDGLMRGGGERMGDGRGKSDGSEHDRGVRLIGQDGRGWESERVGG
jgi:hypothetical protein